MATGANATPLGKLHPSIGAKRGFEAGPGAGGGGNGLMPTPGPPVSLPPLQSYQPPMLNSPFVPQLQFNPGFSSQMQQSVVGSGMMSHGELA